MQSLADARKCYMYAEELQINALLTAVNSEWLAERFYLENELMLECVKGIPPNAGGTVYTGLIKYLVLFGWKRHRSQIGYAICRPSSTIYHGMWSNIWQSC